MPKIPQIIDNSRHKLADVICEIMPNFKQVSIATGYWDLPGTALLIDKIKNLDKIRLLIGREPLIPRHAISAPEPDFPDKDIFHDLENIIQDKKLKEVVIQIKALISAGKLEVKVYRKTFLHAKCYVFGDYKSNEAVGIIGSSNFTKNGLTVNTELNDIEEDSRIVTFQPQSEQQEVGHLFWFDQLWNDPTTENWNGKFIEILEMSPVGDVLFSPYETYIKTLYELYKDELEDVALKESTDKSYELMEFQKRNVQQLLRKLEKYHVAMLSDSVGLGKTYTAIEVMKHYLDSEEGKKRVIVVCPKSLEEQWKAELINSGVMHLKPVILQNINAMKEEQKLDDLASVSLFVVDESHNLRKTGGTRYNALLNWIRNNKKADVLLLTATPINNEIQDLSRQLILGTRGRGDVVDKVMTVDRKTGQSEMKDFFQAVADLQNKINRKLNKEEMPDYAEIKQIMAPIIRTLVVRRTRQGIEKEYGKLIINGKEYEFPKADPQNANYHLPPEMTKKIMENKSQQIDLLSVYSRKPEDIVEKCSMLMHPLDQLELAERVYSEADLTNESPVYFVYQMILMLGFIPYRWRIYQTRYYGKTKEQIKEMRLPAEQSKALQQQRGIYGIFRTIFLKRMESSVYAIEKSLKKYENNLVMFEKGLKQEKILAMKDLDVLCDAMRDEDEEDLSDVDAELLEKHVQDEVDENKYNVEAFKKDITMEKEIIKIISDCLLLFKQGDTKLAKLANVLVELNKTKPAGEKVLVFSYFSDTVEYLKANIQVASGGLVNETNAGFLTGKNRDEATDLAGRFAPIAKHYKQCDKNKGELRYLFSTDILSEGQNLQDCGTIINYDLHWNPVRMIQRNGRVNRLGSEYAKIIIFNMSPDKKLEAYLRLVKRLEGKIELINSTIGIDQSVLGETANPMEFIEIYSDDEQKRLRAYQLAEEAGDFLLAEDDFVHDLKQFANDTEKTEEYKQSIYNIPKGKWAVLPTKKDELLPEVLALSELYKDHEKLIPQFIKMNRNGEERSAMPVLEALRLIRTNETDNRRDVDKLTLDKIKLKEVADIPTNFSIGNEEASLPTGQKAMILRIMHDHNYTLEEIDLVGNAFNTHNHLLNSKMDNLVRDVAKAHRNQKPYNDNLKELIALAREAVAEEETIIIPNQAQSLLLYARENK
ncbi:MAG: helicase-related protein [bacterium]|nr:helicase-related protein [bacterium]